MSLALSRPSIRNDQDLPDDTCTGHGDSRTNRNTYRSLVPSVAFCCSLEAPYGLRIWSLLLARHVPLFGTASKHDRDRNGIRDSGGSVTSIITWVRSPGVFEWG
ncbi:hypothetical protein PILCRDRAFT_384635 [Piloderma croceum F 1598]|uniref:Uncharacterized protein n=1 Tax=Piloderma croceum (strain F 1598) TaxID=765440 RepID=A0A0C3G181_PILCF|nr:hypothetical protein PILCRDRAFT_384635 [Piloderma croceum F 1598]